MTSREGENDIDRTIEYKGWWQLKYVFFKFDPKTWGR